MHEAVLFVDHFVNAYIIHFHIHGQYAGVYALCAAPIASSCDRESVCCTKTKTKRNTQNVENVISASMKDCR